MQLKVSTDYAIRIVLYSAMNKDRADRGERISSGELSEKLGIPQSVVLKLGSKLRKSGILDVSAGATGGFLIERDPYDITLFDIINTFEPTTRINRCLEADQFCSRHAVDTCPVRKEYTVLQELIENHLKSVTIGSLLETPSGEMNCDSLKVHAHEI